ncbi:hypothetical protein TWF694_002638 [Orbilia ellipsospora]|uniref:F-box domain-containing protein n=1 Tax=Orbilia ellipsospora TaxID=2528407 RepID=A0AAV9X3W2_9PEZI
MAVCVNRVEVAFGMEISLMRALSIRDHTTIPATGNLTKTEQSSSVCFESTWNWAKDPAPRQGRMEMRPGPRDSSRKPAVRDQSWLYETKKRSLANTARPSDKEIDKSIDWIRTRITALEFFPNLQDLSIAVNIPPELESNIFIAIFRAIASYRFYKKLQYLVLNVFKKPATGYDYGTDITYTETFVKLSPANQQFLGAEISHPSIYQVVRNTVTPLSSLSEFILCVNGIATPLTDPASKFFELSAFYFHLVTVAPQLKSLDVKTTEDSWDYCTYKLDADTDPTALFKLEFPRLETLESFTLIKFHIPTSDEMERLAQKFPNLQKLEIKLFDPIQRPEWCDDGDPPFPYESLVGCNMQNLKELRLPWPAYYYDRPRLGRMGVGGMGRASNVDPTVLKGWILRMLRGGGVRSLTTIKFEGMRFYNEWHPKVDRGWREIEIKYNMRRWDDGGWWEKDLDFKYEEEFEDIPSW